MTGPSRVLLNEPPPKDRAVDNLAHAWWDRAAEATAIVRAGMQAPALVKPDAVTGALAANTYARRQAIEWEAQR